MKNNFVFSLFIITVLSLTFCFTTSCSDDEGDFGSSLKKENEFINVNYDSIIVNSKTIKLDSIISKSSSFKLGAFTDKTYGTTKADFLSALYYPYNISFPDTVQKLDSAKIIIYYDSWFGDSTALQNVEVYQLSKSLNKEEQYYSNVDVNKYCDKSTLLGEKYFSAANHVIPDSLLRYSYLNHSIEIPLKSTFYNKFFDDFKNGTWDSSNLDEYLKGIYVTTDFGNGCILNVREVSLNVYYKNTLTDGTTSNLYQTLITSKEVKSVNHINHDDIDNYITDLNDTLNIINYLASPANLYTEITIPDTAFNKFSNKTIIKASFIISAVNDSANTSLSAPQTALLLREDKLDDFFVNYGQASKLYAFASTITSYNYYSFDLGYYLQKMVRQIQEDKNTTPDLDKYIERYNKFILIPVSAVTNSAGSSVLRYEQLLSPSAVKLKSGTNDVPMSIQIVSMDN